MASQIGGGSGSGDQQLKLYSYWRSSCSFRLRIALNLKGLKYEYKAVNLVKGEQFSSEYTKLNPLGYVPVFVDGDIVVSDSFAIIMYLEDKYPQHPLLPPDLQKKAINYQAANIVASSIQPLQNLAVLKYIGQKVGPEETLEWAKVHIGKGFAALEELLNNHAGRYATGDEVFLADIFLAPQLYAAIEKFHLDMVYTGDIKCLYPSETQYPLLARLHGEYNKIPAFLDAIPDNQPDAPTK